MSFSYQQQQRMGITPAAIANMLDSLGMDVHCLVNPDPVYDAGMRAWWDAYNTLMRVTLAMDGAAPEYEVDLSPLPF